MAGCRKHFRGNGALQLRTTETRNTRRVNGGEDPQTVHRHLGPGLLESSYHACLCHELELRGISYRSQVVLPLEYKGVQIAKGYVIDLLIEDSLVVEIKSVDKLLPIHSSQLMTYMRLQKVSCGLLLNFNVGILPQGIKRILL